MKLTGAWFLAGITMALTVAGLAAVNAADEVIPHGQEVAPGAALTPEEAQAKMEGPDGFEVELVAAEPDVINPVGMTIDEKGRFWVIESIEYPRNEPGPGRDRIRVLEDTNGDGKVDSVTTFAEGLNIPSGIAVGHGGVWVANAPDILFLQDTTGDGKADKSEVIVTGFDRNDTHELPNSFTWGPDGWLYGLHGVFNYSRIHQGDETFDFSAAIFRIHPVTHEFQLFAEGTSNPWGLAFDAEGNMFISACVIDHLWHITESGYYVRQAGTYPPFTWRIESIVDHRHQMAAYAGLVYLDSDAYPEPYRDALFMGNIHGGAINHDVLQRRGSTYQATPREDFLQANDPWFMPVSQSVGPDGLLYVLDWYDRYHCYQDARRDPEGVNRTHGRIWRLRHSDSPSPDGPFPDMGELSDDQLITHLASRNVYHRETAQRLLAERLISSEADAGTRDKLQHLALEDDTDHKTRMHAIFSLVSSFELDRDFHLAMLEHDVDSVRTWGVRAAGNFADDLDPAIHERVLTMTNDGSPDVKLQLAIAATKLQGRDAVESLAQVLGHAGDDPLIPQIVWANLHPLLADGAPRFLESIEEFDLRESPGLRAVMPRVAERLLAVEDIESEVLASLVRICIEQGLNSEARDTLAALAQRVRTGEVRDDRLARVRQHVEPVLEPILTGEPDHPLYFNAAVTAATWRHASAMSAMHTLARDGSASAEHRVAALEALVTGGAEDTRELAESLLSARDNVPHPLKLGVIRILSRVDSPDVGVAIVAGWDTYDSASRVLAIETLTQRTAWSLALLDAVAEGTVPQQQLNLNQIRSLIATGDDQLRKRVEEVYGQVREQRNPDRERVVAEVTQLAQRLPGDPKRGRAVFGQSCAACHTIYEEGTPLGPDLTVNGRSSFEQIVSNVFDPNLVINTGYRLNIVTTESGRVVAGMITEENDQRIVIQMIGGQEEVIARDKVHDIATSPVSFMPEGLENAMTDQQIVDLLAFLSLTQPPDHPDAILAPGTPIVSGLDPDRIQIPDSVANLLVHADYASNIPDRGEARRGEIGDMIWDPTAGRFMRETEWHEFGVGFGEDLGVIEEDEALYWQAEWDQTVQANLMVFTGTYPNQPQEQTAWKIEIRVDGVWVTHDQGVGGWINSQRYVWGGAGIPPIAFDALRISVFSSDDETPVVSVSFRGEERVSWLVANVVDSSTSLER